MTCTHCKPSGVQACMHTVEVTKREKIPTNKDRYWQEVLKWVHVKECYERFSMYLCWSTYNTKYLNNFQNKQFWQMFRLGPALLSIGWWVVSSIYVLSVVDSFIWRSAVYFKLARWPTSLIDGPFTLKFLVTINVAFHSCCSFS